MLWLWASLLTLSLHIALLNADLVYPQSFDPITYEASNFTSIHAYSMLLWNYNFKWENITLVNLQEDTNVFDWCDINQYTPQGVLPLLEQYYGINETMLNNGLKWMALFGSGQLAQCPPTVNIDFHNAYLLAWDDTVSSLLANTGALGSLDNYYTPPFFHYSKMDNVDKKNGIVFGKKVKSDFFIAMLSYQDTNNLAYTMDLFNSNNISFVISSIENTPNPNDAFIKPISPFYYVYRIVNACAVLINLFSTIKTSQVINLFLTKKKGLQRFHSSGMCLFFTFFGNLFRFVYFLDPYYTFHVCASMASIRVWINTVHTIELSIKMQFVTIDILRKRLVSVTFLLFTFFLVSLDLYTSYSGGVIFFDKYLNGFATSPIGGTAAEQGGITQDAFWKVIILYLLSVIEITVAILVKKYAKQLCAIHEENKDLTQVVTAVNPSKSNNKISPLPASASPIMSNKIIKVPETSSGTMKSIHIISAKMASIMKTKSKNAKMDKDDFYINLASKLNKLSSLMITSGVFMSVAATLYICYGVQNVLYANFNLYIWLLVTSGAYLLVQISSILEIYAVEESLEDLL